MTQLTRDDKLSIVAFLLAAAALVAILMTRLLAPLLAGLLVYELIHLLTPFLQRHISDRRAKLMAVALLSIFVVGTLSGIILGTILFFRSDAGTVANLVQKTSMILEDARAALPPGLTRFLPANSEDLHASAVAWLRSHAKDLQTMGKDTVVVAAQTLIAMVVGALISIYERDVHREPGPLGAALIERARRLAGAFHSIVFSQVRISAINTVFSGIYLAIVLPLFDVHLPLTKTLIGITFFAGLLPVIGNLISNCAIVLVSLAHSPQIAVASLLFLVVIHKLEYFLNARIIGSQIEARAWELLLAMVAMDAIFGVYGLVAAPIYYAFLKSELVNAGLV